MYSIFRPPRAVLLHALSLLVLRPFLNLLSCEMRLGTLSRIHDWGNKKGLQNPHHLQPGLAHESNISRRATGVVSLGEILTDRNTANAVDSVVRLVFLSRYKLKAWI